MVKQLPVFGGTALKGRVLTAAIAMVSGTGFLLFGYDQGVMSGLFSAGQFATDFPQMAEVAPGSPASPTHSPKNPEFDSNVQGAVTAIYEIGAMLGSLLILWKGDAMGRRTSIACGATIMLFGAIVMTAAGAACCSPSTSSQASKLGQFTAGRIITGFGNGMSTSTIPMWQAEISKAHNRGLLVLVEGALIAGGVMIAYWVDYGFYWLDSTSVQWRFPIAFQCFFAIVVLIGILCLPESPRWLVKKGLVEQAAVVMAQMDNTTVDDPAVQQQLNQLNESIGASEKILGEFSYKELLTNGPEQNLYRTSIACVSQIFQQFAGINLITYYASTLFLSIVPESKQARLLTCGNGTEYFGAAIIALFLVDTVGRRNLMLITAFGMSVSMAILTGTVYVIDLPENKGKSNLPESYAAAFFLYFYNTMFAFGWLGMTWLYPPEITPIRIRASANAIATSCNWLGNFIIVLITPPLINGIGAYTYAIFAVLNLLFMPVLWVFFPETKRRSLEEMDLIFAEAHDEGFFKWSHLMTTACYLSLNKKYLSSEELDTELASRFGSDQKKPVDSGNDDAVKEDKKKTTNGTEQVDRDDNSSQEDANSSQEVSSHSQQP